MPEGRDTFAVVGIGTSRSELSGSFALALVCGDGILIWRTEFGHAPRARGHSDQAALNAGIAVRCRTITGALFGLLFGLSFQGEAGPEFRAFAPRALGTADVKEH